MLRMTPAMLTPSMRTPSTMNSSMDLVASYHLIQTSQGLIPVLKGMHSCLKLK